MADDVLAADRQRGYLDDPDTAEPLRWLETCNEEVKDCMVALESMPDPQLDDLWPPRWRSTNAARPFHWTRFVEWAATAFH